MLSGLYIFPGLESMKLFCTIERDKKAQHLLPVTIAPGIREVRRANKIPIDVFTDQVQKSGNVLSMKSFVGPLDNLERRLHVSFRLGFEKSRKKSSAKIDFPKPLIFSSNGTL